MKGGMVDLEIAFRLLVLLRKVDQHGLSDRLFKACDISCYVYTLDLAEA